MLKLNYLDAPRLLYQLGISFYSTFTLCDEEFTHPKQILGMQIGLSERLTNEQIKFLDCIDTFHMVSPTVIIFKTFARMKRENQS